MVPRALTMLHVTQPTGTGVAKHVFELARHQVALGYRVAVASPPDEGFQQRLIDAGVEVRVWSAARASVPRRRELDALRSVIADLDPDLVHLHSSKAGLVGRLVLRGRRPTVFTPNGWSFLVPGWTARPARVWERWASRWTGLTVVVSAGERELSPNARAVARLETLPNGVDVADFEPLDASVAMQLRSALGLTDGPIVICIGRLCDQKGQVALLEAWPTLLACHPDLQLLLVGDGPLRPRIEQLAGPGIHVLGKRDDVPRLLALADVAVQPSLWEGMSYVTLESLAAGVPVVAYDVAGMREAIAEFGVVVSPPGDVRALIAAVDDVVTERTTWVARRSQMVEHIQSWFSADAQYTKVTQLSARLVEGTR